MNDPIYYIIVVKVKLTFQLLTLEIILLTIILYQQYKYQKQSVLFLRIRIRVIIGKAASKFFLRATPQQNCSCRTMTISGYPRDTLVHLEMKNWRKLSSTFTPHPHISLPTPKQASRSTLVCYKNNLSFNLKNSSPFSTAGSGQLRTNAA